MCEVSVADDGVHIDPTGWEHTGGITGPFVVPFNEIGAVSVNDHPVGLVHGIKTGVGLPKTKIGTWHHDGIEDYFCVHKDGPALVLALTPEHRFGQVVVTVLDPTKMQTEIQAHLGKPSNADDNG